MTRTFYKTVQNKLHWAIHGHTAAELIRARADTDAPHVGLETWKRRPAGSGSGREVGPRKAKR